MSDPWAEPHLERSHEIAEDLHGIVEILDELIVDHLREAVANEVQGRPALDKRMQSARRAVEKAARLLDQ